MRIVFTLILVLSAAAARPAAQSGSARPNIVLIMTDDVGYGDFGSYGAPDIRTPNIDSLARDGVRLTDFYANGATCSPTRAGLISGRYQQRVRIEAPLGAEGGRRRERGLPRDRTVAAAAPEEQRLRDRARRQVAPRLEAGVRPARPRLRLLLRLQERLHRLLPAHAPAATRRSRPTCSRTTARGGRGLHDGPDHRAVGAVHRAGTRSRPFFIDVAYNAPHWPYQRARPAVDGAGRGRHLWPFDDRHQHARRLRRDARARRSGRRPRSSRPSTGSACARTRSSSSPTTTAASGCRATRRCSTTRERSGKAASACPRSSAGPGAFRPDASRARWASRWT